jgi:aconitate hydratase
MGVLPLEFHAGDGWEELGLTGTETITIAGIEDLQPGQDLTVLAKREDGTEISFAARARIDSAGELAYYRHGGILHYVLRNLASQSEPVTA